ncbi:MAG: ABC transporter permease [Sphaerochaetaceae bacterium]|nr:ABC transporter permease [Sphaerochaetaceae bacterium]
MKRNETTVLMVIMVAVALMMILLNPGTFLTQNNLKGMAFQLPELGILTFAMMGVMITGGINLSIIATANMAGISAALVLKAMENSPAAGLVLAVITALAVSGGIGVINGTLIAYVGITPILATLGTMTLFNGVAIVVTEGYVISGFSPAVLFIGNGSLAGIPFPLLVFALSAVILTLILRKTRTGFSMYMIGSNATATRFSGIHNEAVLLRTYLISGLFSGMAAMVMISRFNSAKSGYGNSYLLVTILAAVLGGVSSDGGFGRVSGVVVSLITLQLLSSGFNLLRVSSFMTTAIWGFVMILVMVINNIIDTREKRG